LWTEFDIIQSKTEDIEDNEAQAERTNFEDNIIQDIFELTEQRRLIYDEFSGNSRPRRQVQGGPGHISNGSRSVT